MTEADIEHRSNIYIYLYLYLPYHNSLSLKVKPKPLVITLYFTSYLCLTTQGKNSACTVLLCFFVSLFKGSRLKMSIQSVLQRMKNRCSGLSKYPLSTKAIFIPSSRTEIILVVLLGSSTSSGNWAVLIYSAVFWWQAGAFLNIVPRPQHSCQATVHS